LSVGWVKSVFIAAVCRGDTTFEELDRVTMMIFIEWVCERA
jgi:hypothetical protein